MSVSDAVARALANYPSIQIFDAQVAEAAAGIRLARTAFLPRADFLAQANRATRNNIYGVLLPQATLPTISGPPRPENDLTSVWGSAVGFLVSWEPFDFGVRKSQVAAAEASRKRAEASVARTRFEISAMTADAFLTVLAARETVRSAQATIARTKVLETSVGALVKAELRPGADASRAVAERSLAEMQLIQAERAVEAARATLAQLTGIPAKDIQEKTVARGGDVGASGGVDAHPAALEQTAAIDEARANERTLDNAYLPKFTLQGATYARAETTLGPNIANYAAGLTVTFPAMALPGIRAQREVLAAKERAEQARYQTLLRELNGQIEKARISLTAARRMAEQTPVQLDAARTAERQIAARYDAGLATITEVADAQRVLTQAEIDDGLARLSVWRARLQVATAQGDLRGFLKEASGQ